MRRTKTQAAVLAAFLLTAIPNEATTIEFEVDNLAGNSWEYAYTVANDMLATDIEEFTIFFDLALYENLAFVSGPAAWDPLIVQPDPFLPDDGFFDALALLSGIAPGSALGEFRVSFDFLGAGRPGAQFFEILDPITFAVLDSGSTVARLAAAEPGSTSLVLVAAAFLALARPRRRRSPAGSRTST